MNTYAPSDALTKATLNAMVSQLPYLGQIPLKAFSDATKEKYVSIALAQVVPLSLGSIALTQGKDARIPLTKHGALTDEAKQSFVRRIAWWFVPDEVNAVTSALNEDIARLAENGYATELVRLDVENNEVVLVVLSTSRIRQSVDTVFELFVASLASSSAAFAAVKDKYLQYFPRR